MINVTKLFWGILIFVAILYVVVECRKSEVKRRKESEDVLDYFNKTYAKILLVIAELLTFFVIIMNCSYGFVADEIQYVLMVTAILAAVLTYMLVGIVSRWYVIVTTEMIRYRSFLGKEKLIKYGEITNAIIDNDKLHIYIGEQKVITLGNNIAKNNVLYQLKANNIKVNSEVSCNEFVIREPIYLFAIGYVLVLIGILAVFNAVEVNVIWYLIIALILLMFAVYVVVSAFYNRTIISENKICQKIFGESKKEILFSDIKKIERTEEGCEKYIYLYSEQKKEIFICMGNRNASMFEKLIGEQGWE